MNNWELFLDLNLKVVISKARIMLAIKGFVLYLVVASLELKLQRLIDQ